MFGPIWSHTSRNNEKSPSRPQYNRGLLWGRFFAYIILIIFPQYYYLVPIGAFLGALFATLFIYSLAWKQGALPTRLVLAGVAVSSLFSAGTNTLMAFFPDRVQGVLGFMVGGLSAITWQDFRMILPYAILGIILILFLPNKLNILMLGDEVATGLGIKVERTRFIFIIISSIISGGSSFSSRIIRFCRPNSTSYSKTIYRFRL